MDLIHPDLFRVIFLFFRRVNVMIKITLKDGSVKEFENAVSAADITKEISMGLLFYL